MASGTGGRKLQYGTQNNNNNSTNNSSNDFDDFSDEEGWTDTDMNVNNSNSNHMHVNNTKSVRAMPSTQKNKMYKEEHFQHTPAYAYNNTNSNNNNNNNAINPYSIDSALLSFPYKLPANPAPYLSYTQHNNNSTTVNNTNSNNGIRAYTAPSLSPAALNMKRMAHIYARKSHRCNHTLSKNSTTGQRPQTSPAVGTYDNNNDNEGLPDYTHSTSYALETLGNEGPSYDIEVAVSNEALRGQGQAHWASYWNDIEESARARRRRAVGQLFSVHMRHKVMHKAGMGQLNEIEERERREMRRRRKKEEKMHQDRERDEKHLRGESIAYGAAESQRQQLALQFQENIAKAAAAAEAAQKEEEAKKQKEENKHDRSGSLDSNTDVPKSSTDTTIQHTPSRPTDNSSGSTTATPSTSLKHNKNTTARTPSTARARPSTPPTVAANKTAHDNKINDKKLSKDNTNKELTKSRPPKVPHSARLPAPPPRCASTSPVSVQDHSPHTHFHRPTHSKNMSFKHMYADILVNNVQTLPVRLQHVMQAYNKAMNSNTDDNKNNANSDEKQNSSSATDSNTISSLGSPYKPAVTEEKHNNSNTTTDISRIVPNTDISNNPDVPITETEQAYSHATEHGFDPFILYKNYALQQYLYLKLKLYNDSHPPNRFVFSQEPNPRIDTAPLPPKPVPALSRQQIAANIHNNIRQYYTTIQALHESVKHSRSANAIYQILYNDNFLQINPNANDTMQKDEYTKLTQDEIGKMESERFFTLQQQAKTPLKQNRYVHALQYELEYDSLLDKHAIGIASPRIRRIIEANRQLKPNVRHLFEQRMEKQARRTQQNAETYGTPKSSTRSRSADGRPKSSSNNNSDNNSNNNSTNNSIYNDVFAQTAPISTDIIISPNHANTIPTSTDPMSQTWDATTMAQIEPQYESGYIDWYICSQSWPAEPSPLTMYLIRIGLIPPIYTLPDIKPISDDNELVLEAQLCIQELKRQLHVTTWYDPTLAQAESSPSPTTRLNILKSRIVHLTVLRDAIIQVMEGITQREDLIQRLTNSNNDTHTQEILGSLRQVEDHILEGIKSYGMHWNEIIATKTNEGQNKHKKQNKHGDSQTNNDNEQENTDRTNTISTSGSPKHKNKTRLPSATSPKKSPSHHHKDHHSDDTVAFIYRGQNYSDAIHNDRRMLQLIQHNSTQHAPTDPRAVSRERAELEKDKDKGGLLELASLAASRLIARVQEEAAHRRIKLGLGLIRPTSRQ